MIGMIDVEEFIGWWLDRSTANREGIVAMKLKQLASKAKYYTYYRLFSIYCFITAIDYAAITVTAYYVSFYYYH